MGYQRERASAPPITDAELGQIIQQDDLASTQLMVRKAQQYGTFLKDNRLKSSQIRGIFGHVRQIEMNWPTTDDAPAYAKQAARDLVLLKPKMAYQGERVKEVRPLAQLLSLGIDLVDGDRQNFQRFVEFFEAILAYHKAAGGE